MEYEDQNCNSFNMESLQSSLNKSQISSIKKTDNQYLAQAFASNYKQHHQGYDIKDSMEKVNQKCYSLRQNMENQESQQKEIAKDLEMLKKQNLDLDQRVNQITSELRKIMQLDLETQLPEQAHRLDCFSSEVKEQDKNLSLVNEVCKDYVILKNEMFKHASQQ